MRVHTAEKSERELLTLCEEAARTALTLEPKLPAAALAEIAISEIPRDVLDLLGRRLCVLHFSRLIRLQRSKEARKRREQLLLPGLEHLPLTIRISDSDRVPLRKATYTQVRAYYRMLLARHREGRRNDPKLIELKTLLSRMEESPRERRSTVAEVLGIQD